MDEASITTPQVGDIYSSPQRSYHLIVVEYKDDRLYTCFYIEGGYYVPYDILEGIKYNGLTKVA